MQHIPPFLEEHILVHWLLILVASLKGMMPPLYRQWGSLFRWIGAFCIREIDYLVLLSDMGVTYSFHSPPFCLALPTMTQFHDWLHSSWGSLSASINGYRCCFLCLMYMFLPRSAAKSHYLWSSLSFVDAPVDVHGRSHNFPFFHPREALLVSHQVTTLP